MARTSPLPQRSLVVSSLDIGRVLADRDGVTFRAQGTCMYPTIRPGDVLRIRSCPAADAVVGDIAVCRTPAYLFSHRVIAKGERDGHAYIVTRPDRSHVGSDLPTSDDDLLGVVVSVSRKGASVPLQPITNPRVVRWFQRLRLALVEAEPRGRHRLIAMAARVQDRRLYRHLARHWWRRACRRLRFKVRVPFAATLGDAVYRDLEVSAFDVGEMWQGRPVERWTFAAFIDPTSEPAAWVTFVRDDGRSWRAAESYVRVRYRGTGLDDALLQQAEGVLAGAEHAG